MGAYPAEYLCDRPRGRARAGGYVFGEGTRNHQQFHAVRNAVLCKHFAGTRDAQHNIRITDADSNTFEPTSYCRVTSRDAASLG